MYSIVIPIPDFTITETQDEFNKRHSIGATAHLMNHMYSLVNHNYDTRITKRGGVRIDPLLTLLNELDQSLLDNQCWLITNRNRSDNYVRIQSGNKNYRGHSIFFTRYYNYQPPKGILIRHRCDNRNCMNPYHLHLGTAKDNARDTMCRSRNGRGANTDTKLETVIAIQQLLTTDLTMKEIAYQLGVSEYVVHGVKYKRAWQYVT